LARTVLLADDSVTAQNMGRRILMDAGYEVVTVNNGSAALKKIHESKPDLIVLDVYMPGYGGLEVCQRLKESGETARIPVLLSVGKMEPFKADEAKRVRADGHIVKPFEASELLAALTRLEDRIVPQAEMAGGRRGKSEKKTRSWHGEDPLTEFAQVPTDQINYLAEVKKRQSHSDPASEPTQAPVNQESSLAAAAVAPAASTSELVPENVAVTPPPATAASFAAEEFAVQESNVPSQVAGQDEPALTEVQAAGPVTEIPAPAEAPTAEIPTVEAAASKESVLTAPAEPETLTEPQAVPADIASSPVSAVRWVAENVALTAEEASVALEAEMQQAQAVSAAAATEPETPAQDRTTGSVLVVAQTSPETESVNASGVAFAAAASAAVSSEPSAVSTQSVSTGAGDTASVTEAEPPVPSEASAAWENWQQIRDSVMSPQKAAAIAESVAEMAQASLPAQEPAMKEDLAEKQDSVSSDSSSAAPAEEDNSINDIVDSVLADLKPRLMQEIAKKLAAKK
jgi:CheY-like chemotaxis protein